MARQGTLAILLAVMAAGSVHAAPTPITGEQLLRLLQAGPAGGQWRALERVFPAEMHALFNQLAARARVTGLTAAAGRDLGRDTARAAADLIRSNLTYAAAASDARLQTYAATQAALLESLRARSVEECGAEAEALESASGAGAGAVSLQGKVANVVATLDLIQAGRDHPQPHAPFSVSDMPAMEAVWINAGAPKAGVEALLHGSLASGLSAEQRCATGIGLMRGLSTMDPVAAGRFLSYTFRIAAAAGRGGGLSGDAAVTGFESMADIGPAITRWRAAYPDEAQAFFEGLRASNPNGVAASITAAMLGLFRRRADVMATAPDEALIAMAQARADFLKQVRTVDPEHCGGPGSTVDVMQSPAVLAASIRLSSTALDALTAAKSAPTQRAPTAPEDGNALRNGMVAGGVLQTEINAVFNPATAARDPAALCASDLAVYTGISNAPAPAAGRFMARLLAKGAVFGSEAPGKPPASAPAR